MSGTLRLRRRGEEKPQVRASHQSVTRSERKVTGDYFTTAVK